MDSCKQDYSSFLCEIQKSLLVLIDELHRLCSKYNIHPLMLGGTLLGAVRHKGFIPWDDDADFGMLRTETEILINHKDEFKDFCYLETFYSEHDNRTPWLKLRLKNTLFLEKANEGLNLPSEIFIDIIPIDNAPDSLSKQKRQQKRLQIIEALLFTRINRKNDFKHKIIKIISKFVPLTNNQLKRKYIKISKQFNCKETNHIRISSISHRYFNDVFEKRIIESISTYTFEGRTLYSFSDFNQYLTQLYGDYMILPPVENRVNGAHKVVALNFDINNSDTIYFER